MRFNIHKLAAIKNTTLDLRDFTVIIGPNNSNKTYLAYSLYAILSSLYANFFELPFESIQENGIRIYLDQKLISHVRHELNNSVSFTLDHLSEVFQDSNGNSSFLGCSAELEISNEEIISAFSNADYDFLQFWLNYNSIEITHADGYIDFIVKIPKSGSIRDDGEQVEEFKFNAVEFVSAISLQFCRNLFPLPFALPAERNALITTAGVLNVQRLRLLKGDMRRARRRHLNPDQLAFLEAQPVKVSLFARPVEDFLDFLDELSIPSRPRRLNSPFLALSSMIEEGLHGGVFTEFKEQEGGSQELVVRMQNNQTLDLHNASSSVKQLAALVLYLKYRARSGDLLIMDEPEMNLHPRSQAMLLEVLTSLNSLGVKVLLTTHSPYMMAHLNNLVTGYDTPKAEGLLYLKNVSSFIDSKSLSAYELKAGALISLVDSDFGISWQEFSEVAVDLQKKLFELSDRKYEANEVEN